MPIHAKQLRADSITAAQIAAGAVGTSEISDGTVARADLATGIGAAGGGNVNMTASVTISDFDAATVTTVAAPLKGQLFLDVNGVAYEVGNGVRTKAAYLSGNGGTTARANNANVAGDTIHWVGSVAGVELSGADRLTLRGNL